MRRLALATVAAVLLLTGCSSGDGSEGTKATPTPKASESTSASAESPGSSAPACADVWQAGQVLPDDYTTCVEDGETISADVTPCTDGSSLVVHRDMFYAVTGRTIVEPDVAPLQDTDAFGKVYESCTGE